MVRPTTANRDDNGPRFEQLRVLPGEDPDNVVDAAKAEHRPIRSLCLFSGGDDSLVAAHRCQDH
jgi:hypothetical protein